MSLLELLLIIGAGMVLSIIIWLIFFFIKNKVDR